MAVFRVERTQNYTIMSNYHLRDKSISLKAKGLLSQMLRQTPGSSIQSKNLFKDSFELVYELHIPQSEEERIAQVLGSMKGIYGVNVLAPQTKVA